MKLNPRYQRVRREIVCFSLAGIIAISLAFAGCKIFFLIALIISLLLSHAIPLLSRIEQYIPEDDTPQNPIRRTDPEALELIEKARKKHANAPIGEWVTDPNPYKEIDFPGLGAKGNTISFFLDGTGAIDYWGVSREFHTFRWRNIGERKIAYTIEFDDEGDDKEEEELILEYDFFLLEHWSDVPYLYEVGNRGERWFMRYFFGPLSPTL